jgi:hypothetical protein
MGIMGTATAAVEFDFRITTIEPAVQLNQSTKARVTRALFFCARRS